MLFLLYFWHSYQVPEPIVELYFTDAAGRDNMGRQCTYRARFDKLVGEAKKPVKIK